MGAKNKKSVFGKWFNNVTLQSILSDLSHAVSPERLGPRITDRVLWRAMTDEAKIALTFDDGPQATYTPRLLEILDRYQIPATFFLIGKHIEAQLELAQQIARAGHEVANHTYSHPLLLKLQDEQIIEEINRTHRLLNSLDSARPKFLRPPMGLFSKRVLDIVEQTGYQTVVGNVYPRDPHLPGKEKIVRRVLSRVVTGSIIILHDGGNSNHVDRSQTLAAVAEIVPHLQARGFEFVRLSDL
ncbi:MAG: polysaccharide deacetylase family protein [bacterium]